MKSPSRLKAFAVAKILRETQGENLFQWKLSSTKYYRMEWHGSEWMLYGDNMEELLNRITDKSEELFPAAVMCERLKPPAERLLMSMSDRKMLLMRLCVI